MYDSENQMVSALPKMIKLASARDLKEALSNHLKETKQQVRRIEKIFAHLDEKVEDVTCEAMQGLLAEATDLASSRKKSPVLDAAIISAAQKVEHYEIASYGILRSFAEHLKFPDEVVDLIQESLDEEGAADKKLTKIAEGSLFFGGINKLAAKLTARRKG